MIMVSGYLPVAAPPGVLICIIHLDPSATVKTRISFCGALDTRRTVCFLHVLPPTCARAARVARYEDVLSKRGRQLPVNYPRGGDKPRPINVS